MVARAFRSASDAAYRAVKHPVEGTMLTARVFTAEAPATSIRLGAAATERAVKESDLTRYRNLAFATHGLMAGDFKRRCLRFKRLVGEHEYASG